MTPEDRARKALHSMGMRDVDNDADVAAIAEAIRAALRERDAAWAKALERAGVGIYECDRANDTTRWATLRALLEEAGRNG